MTAVSRDTRLLQTFATLADTLVADYDVVELLQVLVDACRDLLDVSDAGILLANPSGQLELIASTSEATHLVEVIQLAAHAGPCLECFRSARPVSVPNMTDVPPVWAEFQVSALGNGFAAMDAIPMRLRDVTIGTLSLLRTVSGPASDDDLVTAQAFADVATIGILHERALHDSRSLAGQLQTALESRVTIEQAKGVVSFTAEIPVTEAFALIRTYARTHGVRLGDVARQVVGRTLRIEPPSS